MAVAVDFHLFTDFLDAAERVVADVRALSRLSKKRRDEIFAALTGAYSVVDAAMLLVITRLGKLLERADRGDRDDFAHELRRLPYTGEWLAIERDMSLCSALRRTRVDMQRSFSGRFSRAAVADWDALDKQMERILSGEAALAGHIAEMLHTLSTHADSVGESGKGFEGARIAVDEAQQSLNAERRRLIRAEADLYPLV